MREMPSPEVFFKEFDCIPWQSMLRHIANYVVEKAPRDVVVLECMPGPAYLYDKIYYRRPDISWVGVDLDPRYVVYNQEHFPRARWVEADLMNWESPIPFDLVICTAGVHHVPYAHQVAFLQRIADWTKTGGYYLGAEPCIRCRYQPSRETKRQSERFRQLAALELNYHYAQHILKHPQTTDEMVEDTMALLANDVLADGEYKFSVAQWLQMLSRTRGFKPWFTVGRTWPTGRSIGKSLQMEVNASKGIKQQLSFGDYWVVAEKR